MYKIFIYLFVTVPFTSAQTGDILDEIFGSNNGNGSPAQNPSQNVPGTGPTPAPDLVDDIFGKPPTGQNTNDRAGQADYQKCTLEGRAGECVPYYLCSNTSEVLEHGEGLIDIRFNEDAPCPDYLTTCCYTSDRLEPTENKGVPTKLPGCGHRNFDGLGFRIKGAQDMEAQFGEFPWMTAILSEEEALGQVLNVYKCGGSLIHPQVVLTGAHCIYDKSPQQLKARLGEWDTQTTNELFQHIDVGVVKKVVHDGFNPRTLANNIGLLFLAQPVTLGDNIDTVCLPPQGANFDHARCTATGWGKDHFGKDGKYQVILKKIDLPIVPFAQCQAALKTTRLGRHFKLHESFLCAGGEPGKDTCRGDGGSPLVCASPQDPTRYFQAGIVSWGIGCGETGIPGVYADVAKFRNWIDLQLNTIGFDTTSYSL